jgi:hypothetical protein
VSLSVEVLFLCLQAGSIGRSLPVLSAFLITFRRDSMDFLQRFNEQIATTTDQGAQYSQRMYLIELMLFGNAEKIGDVDFSTFTFSDLKDTIDDILEYESDETADPIYGEGANIGNPIYEINSLAGLSKEILAIEPQRKKIRRFFNVQSLFFYGSVVRRSSLYSR